MTRLFLALHIISAAAALRAQPVDVERKVWSTEFRQQRLAANQARPAQKAEDPKSAMVGVTLWRLRASQAGDQARLIVHESENPNEMTPERIRSSTKLFPNDRLRISIESAQLGFLYVISRERYADGSAGQPHLIFPSQHILSGENLVRPGQVVEIPEQGNKVPYFRLKRSRPDQVAEELILLVTPARLPGLLVTDRPLPLEASKVEAWTRQWGAPTRSIEMDGKAAWMKSEQLAGQGGTPLRPGDPTPQTLIRVSAKPGAPLMVPIQLRLAR